MWEGDSELHSADEDGNQETRENKDNNSSDRNEIEVTVGSGNENEDEVQGISSTYTCSSLLTSQNSDEHSDHNMWNPVLGLFYHKMIGVCMKMTIDEVTAERIAVSCHFSLDLAANQDNNEGDSDDQGHYLNLANESLLWMTIRDFLSIDNVLEMRTTAHKWSVAMLYVYGPEAELFFILLARDDRNNPASRLEWPELQPSYTQLFE